MLLAQIHDLIMVSRPDIPYVNGVQPHAESRQALDLYAPDGASQAPVVVYVHGGGWRYWDRKGVDEKPIAFTRLGYLFVTIGYRLVPEVRYPGQMADVAAGLRWVRDHIAEYGGDPQRIHLMGFSAGAHMVGLLVSDQRYLQAAGVPVGCIRTVTALDGDCYYIPKQIEMCDEKTQEYHKSVWGDDPAGWDDPSPLTHLNPGLSLPPAMVVHLSNRPDATWQATSFSDRYRAVGGDVRVVGVDTTHMELNKNIGVAGNDASDAVIQFIRSHD